MAFNMFPFTNLHNLNTDWILKTIKELKAQVESALDQLSGSLSDVVHYTSQSKDVSSRRTACTNIHAVSYDSFPLEPGERTQARANIQAADNETVVKIISQSLTGEEKEQARANIGAVSDSDAMITGSISLSVPNTNAVTIELDHLTNQDMLLLTGELGDEDVLIRGVAQPVLDGDAANKAYVDSVSGATGAVLYSSAQSLTSGQQSQARSNIGAAENQLIVTVHNDTENVFTISDNFSDVLDAASGSWPVWFTMRPYGENDDYIGMARVSNSESQIICDLTLSRSNPGSADNEIWYHLYWRDSGGTIILSVTKCTGRYLRPSSISDADKSLVVSAFGVPVWERVKTEYVVDSVSTTPTIALAADNTVYKFTQDLTSLSLTTGQAGSYMICFHSGSTPTTTSFPVSILGLDDFVPEANTYYEVNIMDGRAVWMGWADPVTP